MAHKKKLDEAIDALMALGFAQYEAQAYLGLLRDGPQTGYSVSKSTGIPQPKAYDTLRQLADRGVAMLVTANPATYVARPLNELMVDLERDFDHRMQVAKTNLERLKFTPPTEEPHLVWRTADRAVMLERAANLAGGAKRKLYVSGFKDELAELETPVTAAVAQGCDVVVLHFGELPFQVDGLHAYRHSSTEGRIYPHHQARQLAVVADSARALWALAANGTTWLACLTDDVALSHLVKNYIRHDIFLQRIFERFRDDIQAAFHPGLEGLVRLGGHGDDPLSHWGEIDEQASSG